MKILYKDVKNEELKFLIEDVDDLFILNDLIDEETTVYSWTYRRDESVVESQLRDKRAPKVRLWLGIKVEKVELHESGKRLRVSGKIVHGEFDLGQYHTLNIEEGSEIKVVKLWKEHEIAHITQYIKKRGLSTILFVAIEDREAFFALLRGFGIEELGTVEGHFGGKLLDEKSSDKEKFYDEIFEKLKYETRFDSPVILTGPGFYKEILFKYIQQRDQNLAKKIHLLNANSGGITGINESLRNISSLDILKKSRVAYEISLIEKLFTEIYKNGLYVYGLEQLHASIENGALATLLILQTMFRDEKIRELLMKAHRAGVTIVTISYNHEGGKKLKGFGGVAGLLRFKFDSG